MSSEKGFSLSERTTETPAAARGSSDESARGPTRDARTRYEEGQERRSRRPGCAAPVTESGDVIHETRNFFNHGTRLKQRQNSGATGNGAAAPGRGRRARPSPEPTPRGRARARHTRPAPPALSRSRAARTTQLRGESRHTAQHAARLRGAPPPLLLAAALALLLLVLRLALVQPPHRLGLQLVAAERPVLVVVLRGSDT